MKIFKILQDSILKKKEIIGNIESIDLDSPIVELRRESEVTFESDEIVSISSDEVLDVDDSLNVAKFKNNLRLLVEETKKKRKIDKFVIIREDDIFPYDWEWRVASDETSSEYGKCNLSYAIRMGKAAEMISSNRDSVIKVPVDEKKLYEAASSLDDTYGKIMMPSHFRSTKHFTINTPLGYTGTYNSGISAERNFIVIDDMHEFLKSGYGYSADYVDAYLDITHENLPISSSAVVLIPEDKYSEIISDDEIKENLANRRVVVYRGDESLAINMVLSEMGILPSRVSSRHMEYDSEIGEILEFSMRSLCEDNDLLYAKGHGNINGQGGHFSDLYDSMYIDSHEFDKRFAEFLRNNFSEFSDVIRDDILSRPRDVVTKIGPDKINEAVILFNELERKRTDISRKKYDSDRRLLTDDQRLLFKNTVKLINMFYMNEDVRGRDFEISDLIRRFYHSKNVDEQISAARVINAYIKDKLFVDGNYSM